MITLEPIKLCVERNTAAGASGTEKPGGLVLS